MSAKLNSIAQVGHCSYVSYAHLWYRLSRTSFGAALLCEWIVLRKVLRSPRTELTLVGLEVEELTRHGTAALLTRIICGRPTVISADTIVRPSLALPPAPAPDEEGSVCRAVMLPLALVMAKVKLRGRSVRCILYLNRDILNNLTYSVHIHLRGTYWKNLIYLKQGKTVHKSELLSEWVTERQAHS